MTTSANPKTTATASNVAARKSTRVRVGVGRCIGGVLNQSQDRKWGANHATTVKKRQDAIRASDRYRPKRQARACEDAVARAISYAIEGRPILNYRGRVSSAQGRLAKKCYASIKAAQEHANSSEELDRKLKAFLTKTSSYDIDGMLEGMQKFVAKDRFFF